MPDASDAYFANRELEVTQYRALLNRERAARIIAVGGEKGWGKQWLLNHIQREVKQREWPVALVYVAQAQPLDTIRFLNEVSLQMGGEVAQCNKQVREKYGARERRYVSPEGNGQTAGSIKLMAEQNSTINVYGSVVAGNLLNFAPDPLEREFLEQELTQAFFAGLKSYAAPIMCSLLLYGFSADTYTTLPWLKTVLFPALRRDELTNLLVVVAGETIPGFDGQEWRLTVETAKLGPFEAADVRDYWLKKRQLPEQYLETVQLLAHGKSPQQLALFADTIEQRLKAAPAKG